MTGFRAGDIIAVDYPHVETAQVKRRPALVISASSLGAEDAVLWAVMITSAANKGWPGDVLVSDHRAAGLPIASVIRTEKMTTLECRGAQRIGRCSDELLRQVQSRVASYLGLKAAR